MCHLLHKPHSKRWNGRLMLNHDPMYCTGVSCRLACQLTSNMLHRMHRHAHYMHRHAHYMHTTCTGTCTGTCTLHAHYMHRHAQYMHTTCTGTCTLHTDALECGPCNIGTLASAMSPFANPVMCSVLEMIKTYSQYFGMYYSSACDVPWILNYYMRTLRTTP